MPLYMQLICMMHILNMILLYAGPKADSAHRVVRPLAHPRHSMCSRLLSAMMPANMYAGKGGEKTWESLANFLLKDLTHCFHNGVEEPHLNIIEFYCHKPKLINMVHMTYLFLRASCKSNQVRGERFYFIYLGLKGDWPYLRKAMGLATGPTSRRKCHYCNKPDSWFENSSFFGSL